MSLLVDLDPDVAYPATEPEVSESWPHSRVCAQACIALGDHFAERRRDCFVGSNFNVYYRQRPDSRFVSPDLFVCFGVDPAPIELAASYRIWDAGAPPCFVLEVASEDTHDRDLNEKPAIYLEVGASEYWRFDPTGGEFYPSALQGDRRAGGAWQPIPTALDDDGRLRGHSRVLGLDLHAEPLRLRFRDPLTGLWLPDHNDTRHALIDTRQTLDETRQTLDETRQTLDDTQQVLDETRRQRDAEAAACRAAEAELAALRSRHNDRNGDTPR